MKHRTQTKPHTTPQDHPSPPRSRADHIADFLRHQPKYKSTTAEITKYLAKLENRPSLRPGVVSTSIVADNRAHKSQGQIPRFFSYAEGAPHGEVLLVPTPALLPDISATLRDCHDPAGLIARLIAECNLRVRNDLKHAISKLTWVDFESNFLLLILEACGFTNIEHTKLTGDNGYDAICSYSRGLLRSEVIVSAKHWSTKNVGPDEVQRLRGIKGNADTAVIVTSADFTAGAKIEANASQNQRSVVLINADMIIDYCMSGGIGVSKVASLPDLFHATNLLDRTTNN